MIFKSDDSLRIRMSDCGEKIQWIKGNLKVVSLLQNAHRRLAGGILGCRRSVMHDAMLNRNELERFKVLWRITSSPRSCRGGRQGCRRSNGDTMVDGDQQPGGEDEADVVDSHHPGAIPWTRK
jgi:hypothetical protein